MNIPGVICGVDEAGRGPLAGPVFAAAVILGRGATVVGLADSKKLTPRQRSLLYGRIQERALAWAVASASVEEIDSMNILRASLLAMRRAVEAITAQEGMHVLVDGLHCPELQCRVSPVVKGDSKVAEISAASILAKVTRDRVMVDLHRVYPQYGFDVHKGYPTAAHLAALRQHGVSEVHRRSFSPVKALLDNC
jgi:ribonuclease HII